MLQDFFQRRRDGMHEAQAAPPLQVVTCFPPMFSAITAATCAFDTTSLLAAETDLLDVSALHIETAWQVEDVRQNARRRRVVPRLEPGSIGGAGEASSEATQQGASSRLMTSRSAPLWKDGPKLPVELTEGADRQRPIFRSRSVSLIIGFQGNAKYVGQVEACLWAGGVVQLVKSSIVQMI